MSARLWAAAPQAVTQTAAYSDQGFFLHEDTPHTPPPHMGGLSLHPPKQKHAQNDDKWFLNGKKMEPDKFFPD